MYWHKCTHLYLLTCVHMHALKSTDQTNTHRNWNTGETQKQHTHTNTHTHTPTHTHTHTHTQTQRLVAGDQRCFLTTIRKPQPHHKSLRDSQQRFLKLNVNK